MPLFQPDLEAMPRAQLTALQEERLSALLARLEANTLSPFWSGRLRGHGSAAGSFRRLEDLARFPFTRKTDLRDSYPFGMFAIAMRDVVRLHASSGTRGRPTIVGYSANDIAVFADVNARALAAAGATPDDVIHNAYGYGLFTGGLGFHYGIERLGATSVPVSGGNTPLQLQLMRDLGARGLCATPSFTMLLAERAQEAGVLGDLRLGYACLGAEPWSDELRAKIEDAFDGIDACDVYGLSEVIGPGVATECREQKDGLHVAEDHFYPEIIDPESGEPLPEGSQGELVLTTLTKEAFPVLRYRTGDVTALKSEACPCGRTGRRLARISGRVDDMLVIRGVNVFPSEIEAVVMAQPMLAGQYVIVVDRRGTMPRLEVHAELAGPAGEGAGADLIAALKADLAQRLRISCAVTVGAPGYLQRTEQGKARRVFDRVDARDPLPEPS
ncbi:MAG: AMP-binding protein [Dehalococcoidia bacterium]|nr:AMP-binding protein [Dehalococcoidia bacterium]